MKLFKLFAGLFLVYNEWTGERRISKQLIVYTITFWGSLMVYFFGWDYFEQADVVATATAAMSLLGSALRVESKGGEAVVKPRVRAGIELKEQMEAIEKSLMPELPGD